MFQEEKRDSSNARRLEASLVYAIFWMILAIPGGVLIYNFASAVSIGMPTLIIWLGIATLIIAPDLTGRVVRRLFPGQVRPPTPIRVRIKAFFSDIWGFLKEIASLSRLILLFFAAAFLFPFGIIIAVGYGELFYFLPFIIVSFLIAYKFNKSRKTRGVEAYDDKHFTSYEKSLNDYLSLLKRSKPEEEKPENE